mgnify:FL=1
MLAVISPAKKLDFETAPKFKDHTLPQFIKDTEILVKTARKMSRAKLKQTMKLSDTLAELNYQRYQNFSTPFHLGNAKQAAWVFNGDTYVGLKADTLNKREMAFAQKHLRILSGLYGVLRPLDLIQPYRLEMGARFNPPHRANLYEFWDSRITDNLNALLDDQNDKTLVNLASSEYFKSVRTKELVGPVLTPIFREIKDGQSRTIGMFAKQARGTMARFIITNRVDKTEGLKDFNLSGYQFRSDLSDDNKWVYTRPQPASGK